MSDGVNEINPSEFFGGIDFTAEVQPAQKPAGEPNAFAAIEEMLKLPDGSTKEGMKAAKEGLKMFKDKAAEINSEARQLTIREQIEEISTDVLKSDRDRIRDESWELYRSGKELFDVMKERFITTISPTDRMCTAMATMLNSMSQALSKVLETNTKLRREDEHYREVQAQIAPPTEDNQQMDFTPDKMNEYIDRWSDDFEKQIAEEMKQECEARKGLTKL